MSASMISERKICLMLACLVVIYASAAILWDIKFQGSQRVERQRLLSHFSILDNDLIVENAYKQFYQGDRDNLDSAVKLFREALRKDPASPYRWCDLGEALLETEQVERARYCFSRALEFGPNTAPILLRVANFHFRVDESREALQCTYRVLTLLPEFDAVIFSSYTRMGGGIDDVLNHGLPAIARPAQGYFRHLLSQEAEIADLRKAWTWLSSHSLTDDKLAGEYIDFLLKNHEYDVAVENWVLQLGERKGRYLLSNQLFHGDFEAETTGTSLDWRIRQADKVEVSRDSTVSHQGHWSLRIRFAGNENLAFDHVAQRAVVKPGRYRFEAWLRTEGITTDQGIGFRIFDAESPARLDVRTEPVVGTTDWSKEEKSFRVPPQTRLIEIQVIRRASWKFDNKINGTAWIDDLSLLPTHPVS
jgi:hypothetical protein